MENRSYTPLIYNNLTTHCIHIYNGDAWETKVILKFYIIKAIGLLDEYMDLTIDNREVLYWSLLNLINMRIKSRDESFFRIILGEIFKIEKKHILKKCYYCV